MRRCVLYAAFGLLTQTCVAPASSLPPPTAALEIPAPTPAPVQRCGLVHRAPRTFVGLGEGLSLDDMSAAAQAAQAVVHALDEALCALLLEHVDHETDQSANARAHYQPLTTAIEAGARLEITEIMLAGANIASATAALNLTGTTHDTWQANLTSSERGWHLISFEPAPTR
jgi:hypothetical protein